MSEQLNIILNGKNVKGFKGESILDLAKRYGIEIPTLCHDPRLEPYTSCYICVVEVEGMRGLQPSCSTRIMEGMKIETGNGRVFRARKTALDLLLSNHYADCLGPCKQTCPAGVDVQGYISFIEKGMYSEAIGLIKETNPLPAICGRVCVRPCEVACRRNLLDENTGVGIDYLKRFASDYDLASPEKYKPHIQPSTGKKVAIIGAGPGGLSAAFFLQKAGHQADIFEASPQPGGWLRYGIPEYRLPNDILDQEVANITDMGCTIHYNHQLGSNLSYKALKYKYDSIILAIGSQKGTSIGCEGDDAGNVLSGIDYLKAMEMTGQRYDFKGKTVGVIGGGNTAMDCCRSAMRCGAEKVFVIYRRTEKEMPANPIEIHESKLEGIEYLFLTAPVKVNKDKEGNIESMTCIKMELGEPDASGRRRPVIVADSEFDIKMDFALAAIGQKTTAEFIDDINRNTDIGELKLNKWGDLDADAETLQTGIKRIFACGDGVTGPATLIQAVAQARIAAHSCHQFLMDLPLEPLKKDFLSKRDNFKVQTKDDYLGNYLKKVRHEMPTLEPDNRQNFNEVELGYEDKNIAFEETQRCLECGCSEYFSCDLKRYATDYNAEQKHYEGEFIEYQVDFRHPFIEIDNNKCILCSRCVRICRDVVGANALGLVNRGFKTFVAPSMGTRLQDTSCESCGMCISTCPTGAITENFTFKPGPVKADVSPLICNYCSIGCETKLHHRKGFAMKVSGKPGKVNKKGNICRFAKFGYGYMNDSKRITKPLLKSGNEFREIDFTEALNILSYRIKSVKPDENGFFGGARLTNEELYLVQKLARYAARTNNLSSFHYLGRGEGYMYNSFSNVPFEQLEEASRFFILGSETNKDNAVAGFMFINLKQTKNIPIELITVHKESSMEEKADRTTRISDYYAFVKAANHYLLSKGLQNQLFINDHVKGFDAYKEALLKEKYADLVKKSGCKEEVVSAFAEQFNNEMNAVLIFSEKEVSANASFEIQNLALITGKLGKTASGLIALKEKNNSQGVFDMGVQTEFAIGGVSVTEESWIQRAAEKWNATDIPTNTADLEDLLENGKMQNLFIFGEDPLGCAIDRKIPENWLKKAEFVMVQDYFMTETAQMADLILPASLPAETGGSYASTQRVLQKFDPAEDMPSIPLKPTHEFLLELLNKFGKQEMSDVVDVMMEAISLLPMAEAITYHFNYTVDDNSHRLFDYGCDDLVRRFEKEMEEKLAN